MDDKKLRTVIWSIVIIIIVISIGIMAFLMISLPNRTGGEGVRIAILDSGINQDIRFGSYKVSKELEGSVNLSKSFVTTEYGYASNASIVDDTDGYHGTRVAMQVASRSFGEAPQADLIIARCADSQGTATYQALIAALEWAAYEADADIINISIGGPTITNNTIVELINKIALEEGILTVVSSGNSGDADGYSLSAIEAPADALQAIAVGAYDYEGIAFYSSPGPLKDHSIKPDLVDSGNTLSALGTSFAAPKVTGKAASLMSWCIEQGYKTSPGLLKAALMKSASFDFSVPEYYFGAGIADVELAKEIITSAPKVNNWPMVIYVSPTELPFSMPTIFQGDFWSFPLTIITPIEQVFNFTSDKSESSSIIVIQDEITVNQSGLVNCLLNVTDEYPVGDFVESLYIQGSIGGAFSVDIDVEIASPDLRLGFDTYHSLWDMDHLFGQFRELRLELALANVALTELSHKDNFTQLDNYDALIMADPNTYGLVMDEVGELDTYYQEFANETIDAIVDYVEAGNGLFVLGTTNDSASLEETNRLLSNFNITIEVETIPATIVYDGTTGDYNYVLITEMNTSHPLGTNLPEFDFIGSRLAVEGNNSDAVAWYQNPTNIALAAYETANATIGGRVVVVGSNFMADNWGINGKYLSTYNLNFITEVIEWITGEIISPIPPATIQQGNSGSKSFLGTELTLQSIASTIPLQIPTNSHQILQNPLSVTLEISSTQRKKWQKK